MKAFPIHPAVPLLLSALLLGACGDKADPESASPEAEANAGTVSSPPSGSVSFPAPSIPDGSTLRLEVELESVRGTLDLKSATEGDESGTMRVRRKMWCDFQTQASDVVENPPLILKIREDVTNTTVNWKGEESTTERESPLVEIPFLATRNDLGWIITPEEGTPNEEQAVEIENLVALQNRKLLPDGPVFQGDSWNIDPSFLGALLDRNLSAIQPEGELTLLAIEHSPEGDRAVLEVAIEGKGSTATAGGSMTLHLEGTLLVDVATALERELRLSGSLESVTESDRGRLTTKLPLKLEIKRRIVPNP